MSLVRCFFCLPLPTELTAQLTEWMGRGASRQLRFVSRDNLHITLRFCGEIPAAQAKELSHSVKELLSRSGLEPFTLRLGAPGCFGSPPKVIWAGLEGATAALKSLHDLIERACRDAGLAADSGRFAPHITLARVNWGRGYDVSSSLAPWDLKDCAWQAREVIFMRSHLTPQGPRYSPMAVYGLNEKSSNL